MTTLNTIIEEEKFINAVWDILKSDSNDLRKQQAILNLYRQSTTTAMQRAYEAGKADWLRSEIEKLEGMKQTNVYHTLHCIKGLAENHEHCVRNLTGAESGRNAALTSIITRYKEELLELDKTNGF